MRERERKGTRKLERERKCVCARERERIRIHKTDSYIHIQSVVILDVFGRISAFYEPISILLLLNVQNILRIFSALIDKREGEKFVVCLALTNQG